MASSTIKASTPSGVIYEVTTNTSWIPGTVRSWDVKITNPDGVVAYDNQIRPSGGRVVTDDDFSLTLARLLVGGTYVVLPGLKGTIDIAVSLITAFPTNIYIGGEAKISTGLSGLSGLNITVNGGSAVLSNGTVASALSGTKIVISNGGRFANGDSLISALSGTTIAYGAGGGTIILDAGRTLLDLSSTKIVDYDPNLATIELHNTVAPVSTYTISAHGDRRTVTLYGADGQEISTFEVQLASGVSLPAGHFDTSSPDTNPLYVSFKDGGIYVGICFLAGAQISTPDGERAVETLRAGDDVYVYVNGEILTRKIIWTGMGVTEVRVERPDDLAGYPVRILRHALADNVPSQDLVVTGEHCLYFEGSFIPARMLVNGRSIYFDKSFCSYEYYHIETEDHSVIKANNLLTESYLDTGNRHVFLQAGVFASVGGKLKSWEEDAAGVLTLSRAEVEPIYRRLAERAASANLDDKRVMPIRTRDPDLHLVDEQGQCIRRVRTNGMASIFLVSDSVREVRLVSRFSQPSAMVGAFIDDRRELGILIGRIFFFDSQQCYELTCHLHMHALDGWDVVEAAPCRWTNGNALLPLGCRQLDSVGVLSIEVLSEQDYPLNAEERGFEALRA